VKCAAGAVREPERRKVGIDARITVEGTVYKVHPDLADESVLLLWELFDNELHIEFEGERTVPYYPISGPIPLNRYYFGPVQKRLMSHFAVLIPPGHFLMQLHGGIRQLLSEKHPRSHHRFVGARLHARRTEVAIGVAMLSHLLSVAQPHSVRKQVRST
jgi:hypothetical protein